MRGLFLLYLILAPLMAAAQSVSLGDYPSLQTRFGLLTTTQGTTQATGALTLQGYSDPLVQNHRISIKGAFALQGEAQDWVVVESSHNGNMCPTSYVILRLEQGRLNRSEPFGDCLGQVLDVRLSPGKIEMDLRDPGLKAELQRFAYDGRTLTVSAIAPQGTPQPAAGAGAAVTRWIGTHPTELLNDTGERARFGRIMSLDQMEQLRRAISVANRTEQRGDWVFGAGCMPHQCNAVVGFWALRISDGAAAAGVFDRDATEVLYGFPDTFTDPVLLQFVGEKRWY